MTSRPLFDAPTAAPTRRVKTGRAVPTIPVPPKPPVQSWTITFVAVPDSVPGIIRVRRVLKNAMRRYKLRARIVAEPGTIATLGHSTGNQSSDGHRGRETAFNRTRKNEVAAGTTGRMER